MLTQFAVEKKRKGEKKKKRKILSFIASQSAVKLGRIRERERKNNS